MSDPRPQTKPHTSCRRCTQACLVYFEKTGFYGDITCILSPNKWGRLAWQSDCTGDSYGPQSTAVQLCSGNPRLSSCVLRINSLGSPAYSLNFLHNYIFMIIAHKCFQQSHDATPSPHLHQQQRLPPKPPVPSCLYVCSW